MGRRQLLKLAGAGVAASLVQARAAGGSPRDLKIAALEFTELRGHQETDTGVDEQYQVNPLYVYDALRPPVYQDKPGGVRSREIKALYLRIKAPFLAPMCSDPVAAGPKPHTFNLGSGVTVSGRGSPMGHRYMALSR